MATSLMTITTDMEWVVERISARDESVYLVKPLTGARRQISVPGATDALLRDGRLFITTSTGFLWEVDPDTGSRKRTPQQGSQF